MPFVLCLIIVIAWNIVGRMDNIVGMIFRVWWNFAIKICSFIPFMGWMTIFLIDIGDGTNKAKWVERGFESDQAALDSKNRQWEEEQRRQQMEEARMAAERKEREDALRRAVYQRTGNGDLQFNSDGSYVRRPGGEWQRTSDVERNMRW